MKINLNFYENKKILITGASGYLGTALCEKLSDIPCSILRVYHVRPLTPINRVAKVKDIPADLSDPRVWNDLLKSVDVVFHLAAQTSIRVAAKDSKKDYSANVLPVINLINSCIHNDYHPIVVMASTVTIVGLIDTLPVDETAIDDPQTIYDSDKLTAEIKIKEATSEGYLSGIILRLPNIYGPGSVSDTTDRGILNKAVQNALNGEPLHIWGDGSYIRDYLYIDDVIDAFLRAPILHEQIRGNHFILGTGKGTTITEVMELISQLVLEKRGNKVKLIYQQLPSDIYPIEKRNFIANSKYFTKMTGWKAKISLRKGCSNLIAELLKGDKCE